MEDCFGNSQRKYFRKLKSDQCNLDHSSGSGNSDFDIPESVFVRKDYTANPRNLGDPPLKGGPTDGVTIPVDVLGERFYEALGCDMEHFWPYKDALKALGGLDDVAEEIGLERP